MLKVLIINSLLILYLGSASLVAGQSIVKNSATTEIDSINKLALDTRLTDPEQTVKHATTAFDRAKKINYIDGEAEACRIMGIGQYYMSKYEKALDKYLQAISFFEQSNNLKGIGKVYNNIGNLYLSNDYDKALQYYQKSLSVAKKFNSKAEIAGLDLNIGIIQMKKKNFLPALQKFQNSMQLFKQLDAPILIIQCLENIGDVYNSLRQYDKAETTLNEAFAKANDRHLYYTMASINLTLADVALNQRAFSKAEEKLATGAKYAKMIQNNDLENDYTYAFYQLEYKRKNYLAALTYLKKNYTQDSAYYRQSFSKRITLASDLFNQLENRRKNERTIAHQKYMATLFTASAVVAGLLAALVFLLVINVKRTHKSNQELTRLNAEVSKQKEDLDRINQYLEDIIETRTKDLKIKNKRLADYSLHLSHHIRGPIATLKGIVYIQENDLIDQTECIQLIKKCVFDIDEEIINMSKMLNEHIDNNATE
jgi:tetratricopeptide (TPR) repeat protein